MTGIGRKIAALALAAVLLVAGTAPAAEKPEAVYMTVSTKAFDAAMGEIDAVAGAVLANTPMMFFAQPGMIKMTVMANGLKLSPEFIDGERAAHIVNWYAADGRTRYSILLPVKYVEQALKGLAAYGVEVDSSAAWGHVLTAASGEVHYVVALGDGWVVYDGVEADAKEFAALIGAWRPQEAADTLHISLDVAGLKARFGDDIKTLPAQLKEGMTENVDEEHLPAMEILADYLGDLAVKAINGTGAAELSFNASAQGLEIGGELATVPGTPFAGLVDTLAKSNTKEASLKALSLLGGDVVSVQVCDVDEASFAAIHDDAGALLGKIGATSTEEVSAILKRVQDGLSALKNAAADGSAAVNTVSDGSMVNQAVVVLLKPGKGGELDASLKDLSAFVIETIVSLSTSDEDGQVDDEVASIFGADYASVEINGQPVHHIAMRMNLQNDDEDAGPVAIQQAVNRKMIEGMRYYYGVYKDVLIFTSGAEGEVEYGKIMKRIDGAAGELPAGVIESYKSANGANLGYYAVYVNAFLRLYYGLMKDVIPSLSPEFVQPAENFVKGLGEAAPITATLGASGGKLIIRKSVPVAAVKNAVDSGVKVYMQYMMAQQMKQKMEQPAQGAEE